MKLTKRGEYALRTLIRLGIAAWNNEGVISVSVLAEKEHLPFKFLEAILCELRNHEILTSIRGRNGGYRLAEPPKKISLARIIRIIDGPIALLSCASLYFYKPCENCDQKTCGISPVMKEARDAILKVLEKRSLYDIRDKSEYLLFQGEDQPGK